MRQMLRLMMTALCLGFMAAPGAHAAIIWNFAYSGDGLSVTGKLTTNDKIGGAYLITSITGLHNGDPITGLIPPGGFSFNDNLLYDAFPVVDDLGVSFLVGTATYNLFNTNGFACNVSVYEYAETPDSTCSNAPEVLSISVTRDVPAPPVAVLAGGLLVLAAAKSRKRRQTDGTVTPTMSPSRTIAASCSTLQPSVPAGRFGSTIQR
ncbi:MAG: hypothetical protein EXR07_00815 [Acetobacteraceae bacterium]|nr:hypothetical protein [Acetobacteraceae bacterium]